VKALQGISPQGITVIRSLEDDLLISYERMGIAQVNKFLAQWLAVWTIGSVVLSFSEKSPLFMLVFCWVVEFLVAWLLLYSLFCKKLFHVDGKVLSVKSKLLGFEWSNAFDLQSITKFVQVTNLGKNRKKIQTWGLEIDCNGRTTLLRMQSCEASHWLGRNLAHWVGVEYVEAE